MRTFHTLTIGLVLACAGVVLAAEELSGTDRLLEEVSLLGGRLEAVRTEQDARAWRAQAGRLGDGLGELVFPESGNLVLGEMEYFRPALTGLREWSDSERPLPSLREYRVWSEGLREALAGGQKLAFRAPDASTLAQARVRLTRILRQRSYREVLHSEPGLAEKIADLIYRYVVVPMFGERGTSVRGWVIVGCLVLLALLLAHTVWEVWFIYRGGRRAGGGPGEGALGYALSLASGEDLLRRGDGMRSGGRLTPALGLYYLALISWLAEAGCTRLDRTLTNWEHYRLARSSGRLVPDALGRLERVNAFFDDHCYGGRPLSADMVAGFRADVLGLRSSLDVASR